MSNKGEHKSEHKDDCAYNFKLFSYMAMAIITIAILVGLFLILQHMNDEAETEKTIANQEDVIKNQKLLIALNKNQSNALDLSSIVGSNLLRDIEISMKNQENIIEIINITNRDNAAFFGILENMTNTLEENSKKMDKIMRQLNIPQLNMSG